MHSIQRGMSARMNAMSYRGWSEAGAQGYFLAPSVANKEARLINPADHRGGYILKVRGCLRV